MKRNAATIAALGAIFAVARYYVVPETLIVALNGLLAGSALALLVVMRTLTFNSIVGRLRYRDAGNFTIGLLLTLIGVFCQVGVSIYVRSTAEFGYFNYTATAAALYSETCGLLFMAYSPDIGLGGLEGSDRKAIAVSVAAGAAFAAIVIYLQAFKVLA